VFTSRRAAKRESLMPVFLGQWGGARIPASPALPSRRVVIEKANAYGGRQKLWSHGLRAGGGAAPHFSFASELQVLTPE